MKSYTFKGQRDSRQWQRELGVPRKPFWWTWKKLLQLSPELAELLPHDVRWERPLPRPMADSHFVSLAACLADPRKRAILRVLLLDLLGDDIVELIQAATSERNDQQ